MDPSHQHWENVITNDTGNINVLELIPVLQVIKRYGTRWKNSLIRCYTDNTQVVTAINTGRSSNVSSMSMLRDIFWNSVLNNYHLVAHHIAGSNNVGPDLLSRLPVNSSGECLTKLQLCCRFEGTGHRIVRNNRLNMGRQYGVNQKKPMEKVPTVLC